MSEAKRCTREELKHTILEMHSLITQMTEPKRLAYLQGFNNHDCDLVHHTARGAWDLGRQTTILLGYER